MMYGESNMKEIMNWCVCDAMKVIRLTINKLAKLFRKFIPEAWQGGA